MTDQRPSMALADEAQSEASESPRPATIASLELSEVPGYQIRRLQQIAVAIFLQDVEGTGLTPVQFAALHATVERPGIDQRTLARTIGLDTSTVAGVVDRLEARGLIQRKASPEDRRVRLLHATAVGHQTYAQALPSVRRAQDRILAPLPAPERAQFMRMLCTLVTANNELSRAPSASE